MCISRVTSTNFARFFGRKISNFLFPKSGIRSSAWSEVKVTFMHKKECQQSVGVW
jgi:hypothetical protein